MKPEFSACQLLTRIVAECRLIAVIVLVSSTRAASVPDSLRLTREVEPLAQAVELTLDPARDDYSGRVAIDVIVHAPVTAFRLHALGPKLHSATLRSRAGPETSLDCEVTEPKTGIVTLSAPNPIAPGAYVLSITFTHKYARNALGLYKTVSRGDAYLFTQFEDAYARKAFPCWDEPSFKIPWQLTLNVPAGVEAVANYPAAQESRSGETKTIAFGRTPPMPSYLVALAVGPFEYTPIAGMSVPGRIISPRGQSTLASEAARISPALLRGLEEYFGLPYPYAKLDLIAVPEFASGAMENVGLITFRDTILLLDPNRVHFSSRRNLTHIIAHEMAHMWFGNLVTMSWWDDLWLNESFATWMQEKIFAEHHPEFRVQLTAVNTTEIAMTADSRPSVLPIRREVRAGGDLWGSNALTYNKGKAILYMVEGWIGPEKFRTAMRTYFLKHRWGNTTAPDLWEAFDAASGENISALLAGFTDNPGVPLVTFSTLPDGRVQLTQKRFHTLAGTPVPGQWQVPVTFTWGARGEIKQHRVLLRGATQVLDVPELTDAEWIYPNAGENGYYRWSLPSVLNARLVSRATTVLSPQERLGLIHNANSTFQAGELSGADYLATLVAFANDREPEVIQQAASGLIGVGSLITRPLKSPAFVAMRNALLKPTLDGIGLVARPGEAEHVGSLRAMLLNWFGRDAADPNVVARARTFTHDFLRDPASVEPALTGTSLGIAAYHGDVILFEKFVAALETMKTPASRAAVVGALGRFSDAGIAARALELSLEPLLNSQEFFTIVMSVAGNTELRAMAIDWFMANYTAVSSKASQRQMASAIYLAGANPEPFARLRKFLEEPSRRSPSADSNIVIAADRVAIAQRLRETQTDSILSYLTSFSGVAAPADYEQRTRPVTVQDLRILERADELLRDESVWNRNDDRVCPDDEAAGKRSLFCALQKACVDILGSYDHRRVALQEVRFAVEDATRGKKFEHRLRDFNNLPETQFSDIKGIFAVATARVKSRLDAASK